MGTPPPPPGSDSARYAYLVARLRNKQITMSEATELFEMQQATLASALTAAGRSPPPPPPSGDTGGTTTPPTATASTPVPADDLFWMGMLAVGAGAGVLAAILRRGQAGANPAPPRAPPAP